MYIISRLGVDATLLSTLTSKIESSKGTNVHVRSPDAKQISSDPTIQILVYHPSILV